MDTRIQKKKTAEAKNIRPAEKNLVTHKNSEKNYAFPITKLRSAILMATPFLTC